MAFVMNHVVSQTARHEGVVGAVSARCRAKEPCCLKTLIVFVYTVQIVTNGTDGILCYYQVSEDVK